MTNDASRLNILHKRLIPVIIVFGMVMIGFGLLLYTQLDSMLKGFEKELVEKKSTDASKLYAAGLGGEIEKLDNIARIMEQEDPRNSSEDLERIAVTFIESNFSNEPNVFVGLLAADCSALYGEALSPSDYKGILLSLRGIGGISYTPSGGVLFSYPIRNKGNVRYVLYELRPSSNFGAAFPIEIPEDCDNMMLMTRSGDIVVPFVTDSEIDADFYNSRSVRETFQKLLQGMELKTTSAELIDTTRGEKYFFTAEVK
ncbi:MAG: hypothetical protein IJ679_09555, partial [Lachnospiraceae bacterium]|nr:hypothetical protein [Lachnospiraceae bacterium]